MTSSRHLLLLLGCCCSLVFASTTACLAQSPALPGAAYPGSLPWDMRQQYYEQVPDRNDRYADRSPLDRLFQQAVNESWFRLDYVQWNIDRPDNNLIGAPVPGVPEPDLGFTINDATTGTPSVDGDGAQVLNYAARTGGIDLDNIPGVRLTYGLETTQGTFEANVMWLLQQTRSLDEGPPFPLRGSRNAENAFIGTVAIPFSIEGGPANQAVVTDRLAVNYDTSLFSTEMNFIFDDFRASNGFHFQYLLGARYMRFRETMQLLGTNAAIPASGGNPATPATDAQFNSEALNQIFGPQIGAKIELRDDVFTIGAKPALTMGINHMNSEASGNQPSAAIDDTLPLIVNKNSNDLFSPIISLQAYSQIRLTANVKLFGSYDLMYMNGVSRPYDTIIYDVGTATSNGFGAGKDHSSLLNQGFSVGMLIEF